MSSDCFISGLMLLGQKGCLLLQWVYLFANEESVENAWQSHFYADCFPRFPQRQFQKRAVALRSERDRNVPKYFVLSMHPLARIRHPSNRNMLLQMLPIRPRPKAQKCNLYKDLPAFRGLALRRLKPHQ